MGCTAIRVGDLETRDLKLERCRFAARLPDGETECSFLGRVPPHSVKGERRRLFMIQAKAIHHIGIAVSSIAEQRSYYEGVLGGVFEGIEDVPLQKVRVGFFRFGDAASGVLIELLEPMTADSPIAKHIEKRGQGLHHVAYEVSDIKGRVEALKRAGFSLIDEKPREGAHHNWIAFINPKSTHGVLTELCEPREA